VPGFILHLGANVRCAHGGSALPSSPSPRVLVMGQPAATLPAPWTIAGCTLPPNAGGPCATAQFTTSSLRVFAVGQPVLLLDSQATCIPTGTPLIVGGAQTRVVGT
jgi:hypothetical protein